jgi:hypothetical protein
VSALRVVCAFVLAVATTSGCGDMSDTVDRRYATLADARREGLFGRGWLPDVLPPSARAIRTVNNLDLDTSSGEFSLAPQDMPAFSTRLRRGAAVMRFDGWGDTVEGYADDGYAAWSYRDDGAVWTFFCNAAVGRCKYFMHALS